MLCILEKVVTKHFLCTVSIKSTVDKKNKNSPIKRTVYLKKIIAPHTKNMVHTFNRNYRVQKMFCPVVCNIIVMLEPEESPIFCLKENLIWMKEMSEKCSTDQRFILKDITS